LVAQYDAVLATGHIAPHETLRLLQEARRRGVRRMLVTHASEIVPGMSVDQQREAVSCGAFVEHCLLAILPNTAYPVSTEEIYDQIRQVGVDRAIVSSDLGQAANGPIVEGFSRCLGKLAQTGFSDSEMRTMVVDNPKTLLTDRKRAGS
jgi:predicted metal-dependent phosphotriesterase family hydrolase